MENADPKHVRSRAPKLIGALVLLGIGVVALAFALGWRPITTPAPKTAEVDEKTMQAAERDEARIRQEVESGKSTLGGP